MTSVFVHGSRQGYALAPWTSVVPKPALPVANEPALGYLLRLVARHGYRDVVANASWLADMLEGMFGDGSAHGVQLRWSRRGRAARHRRRRARGPGSAARRRRADPRAERRRPARRRPRGVERAHREVGRCATLALLPVADPSEYGVAVLDDPAADHGIPGEAGARDRAEPPREHRHLRRAARTCSTCARSGGSPTSAPSCSRACSQEGSTCRGARSAAPYWNDIGDLDEWRASNVAVVDGGVDVGPGPWSDEDGPATGCSCTRRADRSPRRRSTARA